MALLSPELFDKLSNISISKRDRQFIYIAFGLSWCAVGYLVWRGADNELHRIAMNGVLWLIAALVILFVTAGAVKRKQAGDSVKGGGGPTPTPAPQAPVEINIGAASETPPPVEADVKEVKADVKAVKKKVRA